MHGDSFTAVLSNLDTKNARGINSTIETTYVDFPIQAKTAFEAAVAIWESYIISSQEIKIQATWESLAGSTLAQSGATRIYRNFSSAPLKDVWYPAALAEAISGENLNGEEFEINVSLNRNINWSFNTNGLPENGKFDMVSVILHEIAHGLGFNSSFNLTDDGVKGEWGQTLIPYIFDIYVQNSSNELLQDTRLFGNPSVSLKEELTSNNLFFFLGTNIYSGRLPQLSAPNPFRIGASVSHLDEGTYPQGNENSLMTPSVRSSEVIHTPGELTLLILYQLGWGIRNLEVTGLLSSSSELISEQPLVYPNPANQEFTIYIPTSISGEYSVSIYNQSGRKFYTSSDSTSVSFTKKVNVNNWIPATYFVEITTNNSRVVKKLIVVN